MRPCPTAGREPNLSNCRKDICLQGSHLLPFTCYGVWSELFALSVAWPVSWSVKRDHHSASLLSLSPSHVSQTQANGSPRPGSSLVKDTRTFLGPSRKRQGGGLPGSALPKPPASAAWGTSCASTSSQMPRPPPPIARIVGSSGPWPPPPQPAPLQLRGNLPPWPCGATSGSPLFLCIPSSPIPSHPTPQGQPTHRTLLSHQEE